MSEIEKIYENAGVNKIKIKRCSGIKQSICLHNCNECESFDYKYPSFTAEKQLELIKLIANRKGYPDYEYFGNLFDDYIQLLDFNEALAKLVNFLWQDLTESEHEQIKEILQ